MAEEPDAIRVLLLPLDGPPALVPMAVVAEVTAYGTPEMLNEGPDWLMGFIHWRGQRVPLVSLDRALGRGSGPGRTGRPRSLVVFHAMTRDPDLPYYAVVTAAPPHPTMAREMELGHRGRAAEPYGWGCVELAEAGMVDIPDLERLEADLVEAVRRCSITSA
ncbi:MAG: chemotaxis protein CheW [Gammaproteobacteria bacterium]|nr:chemotaxis protein CheW [Gammaproteobacteria bacterium]